MPTITDRAGATKQGGSCNRKNRRTPESGEAVPETQNDWEAIEREYRAGLVSIAEIARTYGLASPTIVKKAKRLGWSRDLTAAVRSSIRAKLVAANADTNAIDAKDIVETAANRGASVVLTHRNDIANLRRLEQSLIEEIENSPTKLYITQYQGGIIEKTVALTAAERAAAAANLAQVQHKRIALERQAFGLDESAGDGDESPGSLYLEILKRVRLRVSPGAN